MIDISVFKGEIPLIAPRLLPDGYASAAINCSLINGNLEPIRGSTDEFILEDGAQSIYRLSDRWLQWGVPVQIIQDIVYNASGRIFIANDGYPKETDRYIALDTEPYPSATRRLGIAAPDFALTFTIATEGTGAANEVSYCYERVGKRDDGTVVRSAYSPATKVETAKTDSVIKLTGFIDAAEEGVHTTHYWIYRLEEAQQGADFQFIAEISKGITPLEYVDDVSTQAFETIPDVSWTAPVDNIKGFTVGSNGMIFGYAGNVLYVSETNTPYAFPYAYSLTMPSEIVGLGFTGTFLVVFTKISPVLIYGSEPGGLSQEVLSVELPCKSERSIVNVRGGVIFASTLGLYLIDSGGNINNLTIKTFSQEQWNALPVLNLFAFHYNDAYLGFFKGTNQGIEFKVGQRAIRHFQTDGSVWGGRYVSTVANAVYQFITADGYQFITADGYQFLVTGDSYGISYDTLYLIQSSETGERKIIAWDVADVYIDYIWHSKEYSLLRKSILTACRVQGDFSLGTVQVELFCDDTLIWTKAIGSEGITRVPGQSGSNFRIHLTGKARIERILFGASRSEVISG